MAHYVFQRNNGWGDYDYIRSFDTMEITDYKEEAAQVEDRYLAYIDMGYLNQLGFFAVGLRPLALRIEPYLLFRPRGMGYRPVGVPRPPRDHGFEPPPPPRPRARRPRAPHGGIIGDIVRAIASPPSPRRQPRSPRPPRPPRDGGPRGGRGGRI